MKLENGHFFSLPHGGRSLGRCGRRPQRLVRRLCEEEQAERDTVRTGVTWQRASASKLRASAGAQYHRDGLQRADDGSADVVDDHHALPRERLVLFRELR